MNTKAQTVVDERMTRMSPPSPEAGSIGRYGVYPVGMYTGLPNITIPIHNLKVGDLELPISLSYHGSGIKVNDRASFVGLGWNLNAGGVINRVVMGLPDDDVYGIFNQGMNKRAAEVSITEWENVKKVSEQFLDSEPDLFYYNFMGISGRFICDKDKKVIKITHDDVKIEYLNGVFKVTDTRGRVMKFEEKAYHVNFSEAGNKMGMPVTSWYLTSILLENRKDVINFSYIVNAETNIKTIDYSISLGIFYNQRYMPSFPYKSYLDPYQKNDLIKTDFYENTQDKYLSEITFPNGKIRFVSSDRQDYGGDKLDSIIVYNDKSVLKKVFLDHGYFYSDAGYNPYADTKDKYRLKLLGVKEFGVTGNAFQQYKMEYEEQYQLPPRNNCGVDFWGYFNGQVNNVHLMPLDDSGAQYQNGIVTTGLTNAANRTVSEAHLKTGMLKRIYFPTGGFTDFEFEANRVGDGANGTQIGPGLRINRIKNYSLAGALVKQEDYKYGVNESGLGQIRFFNYVFKKRTYPQNYYFGDLQSIEVKVSSVLEVSSNPLLSYSDVGGNIIVYPTVTKYEISPTGDNGKSIYNYDFEMNDIDLQERPEPQNLINAAWEYGQLLSEKHYKKIGAQYVLAKEKGNSYDRFTLKNIYGLKIGKKANVINGAIANGLNNGYNYYNEYWYKYDYPIPSGLKRVKESYEKDYGDDGVTVLQEQLIKSYYNADDRVLPGKVEITDSKGNSKSQLIRYPQDKAAITGLSLAESNAIDTLMSNNRLETVIERENYINTTFQERFHFTYALRPDNKGPVWLNKLKVKRGTASEEERYMISEYDEKGNPLTRSMPAGPKNSFIWGHKLHYLLAEASNAPRNEIYQQGFEEPELGLDFEENVIYDKTKSHTGKYSGRIINPNATEMVSHSSKRLNISLPAPKKFTFSGWVYSNGPTVQLFLFMMKAGETEYNTYNDSMLTGVTNKWVYMKKEFLVPADVTQMFLRLDNNSVGTVWFDDLRIQPSDAAMSTYTYEPLVGVTSAIDDSGRTVYYEYDTFQRLMNIKDQNGFIIKNYDYHYKP